MRLTCLRCGHQVELAMGEHGMRRLCVCGQDYANPEVVYTGTRPSERAAERSRYQAFRAAGLVKNVGGFALGMSLLGLVFFPFGLLGAGVGVYVLTMLRGPVGRYSGHRAAALAVGLGVATFVGQGAFALSWVREQRLARLTEQQKTAAEDLRALVRAEKLFRASRDTFGTFDEVRYYPPYGCYTVFLGPDDRKVGSCSGAEGVPLPEGFAPAVSESSFTAVAVGNLDDDEVLDVWVVSDRGDVTHAVDDLAED